MNDEANKEAEKEEPVKTSEALFRAADLIEKKGWVQHTAKDEKGRHCLVGAIGGIGTGPELHYEYVAAEIAGLRYDATVEELITSGYQVDLAGWNDHPDRTPTEVIDILRFAGKRALEDEAAA